MSRHHSLFDRFIVQPRHSWVGPLVAVMLLVIQLAGAALGGEWPSLRDGRWRAIVVSPVVIFYVLMVARWLDRTGRAVLDSLRPVVITGDDRFDDLVSRLEHLRARDEVVAVVIGLLFGGITLLPSLGGQPTWVGVTWAVNTVLLYGLLAWATFATVAGSRVIAALLRRPLRIDPLDASPFEAFGLQSLRLGLVFMGGTTLSLLFTVTQPGILRQPMFWLIAVPLVTLPIVVFFLNMQPIHRVLAAAKKQELRRLDRHLRETCHALVQCIEAGGDDAALSRRLQALTDYEHRLLAARTWPYDTVMLRTLFFSVLLPGATLVGKILGDQFFD